MVRLYQSRRIAYRGPFSNFTFHYGEIISRPVSLLLRYCFISLHSIMVRLYLNAEIQFDALDRPLHSIMVRLYPPVKQAPGRLVPTLHSIMVRLYHGRPGSNGRPDPNFTFHYGEIISRKPCFVLETTCIFTFHYGEIISFLPAFAGILFILYIPLWWDYIFKVAREIL